MKRPKSRILSVESLEGREMMAADLSHAHRDALIERSGFRIAQHHE